MSTSTGKRREVAQRGVAGAEVVDREPDAERASARASARRSSSVSRRKRGLGELEHQPLRRAARSRRAPRATSSTSVGSLNWALGEVDAHRQRRRRPRGSRRHSAACRHASRSTQRPSGSIRPAVLGDRDELARQQQAARRVLPAHQRLDADEPPAAQVDDRLVVEHAARRAQRLAPAPPRARAARPSRRASRARRPAAGPCPAPSRGTAPGRRCAAGRRPGRAPTAIPMLAPMKTSRPRTVNGSLSASRIRFATRRDRGRSSTSSSRTTNSSPPKRAAVSAARTQREQPRPRPRAAARRRRRGRGCR